MAGARGALGAPAPGPVAAACSSPTVTATAPSPSTAAGTARASVPSTSPATPRSARRMVSPALQSHPPAQRKDAIPKCTHTSCPWVTRTRYQGLLHSPLNIHIWGGAIAFCWGCDPLQLGGRCVASLLSLHAPAIPGSLLHLRNGRGRQRFLPASRSFRATFRLSFQAKAFGSSSARSTTATTLRIWTGIAWSGFPSMQECHPETDASSFAEPGGGANLKSSRPK